MRGVSKRCAFVVAIGVGRIQTEDEEQIGA